MAIEVLFKAYCDSAKHRGQGIEGRTVDPIALNGKGARVLELCDECIDELIMPLKELLAEVGRKPEDKAQTAPTASDRERLNCPLCDYSSLNRGTMRDHAKNAHDTTLAAIETKLGKTLDGKPLEVKCSYCEVMFSTNRGRVRHENSVHTDEVAAKSAPIKSVKKPTTAKPRKAAAKRSA